MSRCRYTSSCKPAQELADKIVTQCQAKNRLWNLDCQIKVQESLIRSAEITILKYKKEKRLIEEKINSLPKTKRGLPKTADPTDGVALTAEESIVDEQDNEDMKHIP